MNRAFLKNRIFTIVNNISRIEKSDEAIPDKIKMVNHAKKVKAINENIYVSLFGDLPPDLAVLRYAKWVMIFV